MTEGELRVVAGRGGLSTWRGVSLLLLSLSQATRSNTYRPGAPQFPCPAHYSEPAPPTNRSVHQLRPQDIGLVASVGDSITAGTGALASNILQVDQILRFCHQCQ